MFTYEEEAALGPMFGLYNIELTSIKPNYEAMIKQGQLKVTDMGIATSKYNQKFSFFNLLASLWQQLACQNGVIQRACITVF